MDAMGGWHRKAGNFELGMTSFQVCCSEQDLDFLLHVIPTWIAPSLCMLIPSTELGSGFLAALARGAIPGSSPQGGKRLLAICRQGFAL